MQLTGIHHLTAVSADAPGNLKFYTQVLGMRLVKKTVNQDDVSAYHLFYADALGSPGTDITFFDWPVPPERRGTHSIVRTGMRVAGEGTIEWWKSRLAELGVKHGEIEERDGRPTLDFEDFEGQRLSLVDDGGRGEAHPWERSPVPAERQIRGLGPITVSVPMLDVTEIILTELMEMRPVRDYPTPGSGGTTTHVYAMQPGEPGAGQVLVRPTAVGICGSDLHLMDGFIPTMEPGDILGHEFMGEDVEQDLGVGGQAHD